VARLGAPRVSPRRKHKCHGEGVKFFTGSKHLVHPWCLRPAAARVSGTDEQTNTQTNKQTDRQLCGEGLITNCGAGLFARWRHSCSWNQPCIIEMR